MICTCWRHLLPFQVIPSKCSCIVNPLLREAEVVPAPGLPVPFGLDPESRRQRAMRSPAAERPDGADADADAERRYAQWREELIRRNPRPTAPAHGGDGECAAASGAGARPSLGPSSKCGGGTCPVHLYSEWLFLRDSLLRRELLTCLAADADEYCGDGGAAALLATPADVVNMNQLHASQCPGLQDCDTTDENNAQSRTLQPDRRLRLAIAETRALQRNVPGRPPQGCCEEHHDDDGHGDGDGDGGDGHGGRPVVDPEVHIRMPVHAGEKLPGPGYQDPDVQPVFDAQPLSVAQESSRHGRSRNRQ